MIYVLSVTFNIILLFYILKKMGFYNYTTDTYNSNDDACYVFGCACLFSVMCILPPINFLLNFILPIFLFIFYKRDWK